MGDSDWDLIDYVDMLDDPEFLNISLQVANYEYKHALTEHERQIAKWRLTGVSMLCAITIEGA